MQPARRRPDADAVVHEYLHTIGAFVGKEISGVRVGRAEDCHHAGKCGIGARAHIQRRGGQPGGVDADHLRIAADQLANWAAALRGQVSAIDSAPLRSSTSISWPPGCAMAEGSCTDMNAD